VLNKKIPKQIANRYEVLSLIGSGGMSNVYEVKHMVTQERLAIKVIKHKQTSAPIDSQSNTRFLREASLSQRLKTTGVVKIYDAWVDEHASYLVMEFLDGDTLRALAQKRKITRKQALSYVIQALEIIQEAHEHKIIHRDLKPENLFVCKNQKETPIKLLDFGLSRQSDDFALTHTGYFLGTPWYMSPEQAMNPKECTVISDIWSMGVILYEILTDQVPFEGETIPLICMHIYKSPHRPLVEINPNLPKSLSILIDQCLEKEASKRPESAQILAEQLKDELSIHGHLALLNEIFVG
jgi:serine/threonine-protein kinase